EGAALFAADTTNQLTREAEERREKFKLMVEHADVALSLYDAESRQLIQASRRYLDILERSTDAPRNDLIGGKFEESNFIIPPEEAVAFFQKVLDSRATSRLQDIRRKLLRDNA